MTRIHQVLVSAVPGDAITAVTLELQALLAERAPSGVYARYIHPEMEGRFEFLEALAAGRTADAGDDIVVYHASIGEAPVFEFLRDAPERLVVAYHNISPPAAFERHDPSFSLRLEAGRREVAALAPRCALALANSSYSAAELEAMGYRDVRVAPLLPDWRRLLDVPADPELLRRVDSFNREGPVILFVGQLLPHKRPDLLLSAFHVLSTYLRHDAGLVLVGAPRLAGYFRSLTAAVAELNLRPVVMTGAVSDAELAAWYRRADVFVTATEHEGLCVPLVEAMAFGVPVVARDVTAVPGTVGPAGLVLPADGGAELIAQAADLVLGDAAVSRELARRGRERLAAFEPAVARAAFRDRVLEAAGASGGGG